MGSFGGLEWIVIGLAVLLLFGAKRIPELARGLGQGIKEFRKASDDIKREIEEGKSDIVNPPKSETQASGETPPPRETPAPRETNDNVENP